MRVRYLKNGIDDIVEAEVVAAGSQTFYVKGIKVGHLVAVPEKFVVSCYYSNAKDNPPSIYQYVKTSNEIKDVDFSLMDLFKVEH